MPRQKNLQSHNHKRRKDSKEDATEFQYKNGMYHLLGVIKTSKFGRKSERYFITKKVCIIFVYVIDR